MKKSTPFGGLRTALKINVSSKSSTNHIFFSLAVRELHSLRTLSLKDFFELFLRLQREPQQHVTQCPSASNPTLRQQKQGEQQSRAQIGIEAQFKILKVRADRDLMKVGVDARTSQVF